MENTPTNSSVGTIETDYFCPSCNYNLIYQKVFRDDRYDLLLVRCSECGKVFPAGETTSVFHLWLNRLQVFIATFYTIGVLNLFLGCLFFIGVFAAAMFWSTLGWHEGQYMPHYQIAQIDPDSRLRGNWIEQYFGFLIFGGLSIFLSIVIGLLASVLLWHKGRSMVIWMAFMPALAITVGYVLATLDSQPERMGFAISWGWKVESILMALCVAAALVTVVFGRPVVRWLLWFILPPKMRQWLAFLWHVDGLRVPISLHGKG